MKDVFFTLDDIKDFLKQEFDLNWTGKFMIKFSTKEFIDASIDHFLPHGYRPLFLLKTNDNKKVIAAIDIGNWSFILDNKKTGEEIDKSEKWENFVFLRHVKSDYIKENKFGVDRVLDYVTEYLGYLHKKGNPQWLGLVYCPKLEKCRKLCEYDLLNDQPTSLVFCENKEVVKKDVNIVELLNKLSFEWFVDGINRNRSEFYFYNT